MTHQTFRSLILAGAILAMAGAYAQQPTDATPAPAAPSPTAATPSPTAATPAPAAQPTDKPSGPSADILKRAKLDGYRAKLRKGQTLFCKDTVELGTHFSNETCIDENQLLTVMDREQQQRDSLTNHSCQGCSGK